MSVYQDPFRGLFTLLWGWYVVVVVVVFLVKHMCPILPCCREEEHDRGDVTKRR